MTAPAVVDLDALATRKGRNMKYYRDSWRGLRDHFAKEFPSWTPEQLDAEATRQADAYHRVAGAESPRC